MRVYASLPIALASLAITLLAAGSAPAQGMVADHRAADQFEAIPAGVFATVVQDYHVFYATASHGSQMLVGMAMLNEDSGGLYPLMNHHYHSGSIPPYGDDTWVAPTRDYLHAHPECRIVIWNWCWGHDSGDADQVIQPYLDRMNQLESEFPTVTFVYSTGHLTGSGPDGRAMVNNEVIRDYCLENGKVLFDFAAIESHDPSGHYYPYADDGGTNWVYDWIDAHPEYPWPDLADYQSEEPGLELNDCEWQHAHCFMCYRKGQALWWLLARIAGWQGVTSAGDLPEPTVRLDPNWPNPFNPLTNLSFSLPTAGEVNLAVLDSRGRLVRTLARGHHDAGSHRYVWDGRGDDGRTQPSGSYFCRLAVGQQRQVRKISFVK